MNELEPVAVGIIHARGGSRRVPLKNLKLLGGRPLIAWMIDAARSAKTLSRVIVSTDHDEIARVALECGAEVPFRRPAELAEDVPSAWVTRHAVEWLERAGKRVDIVVTLQPTTPFTTGADIDACVRTLITTGADSVITVCPIRERPEWMIKIDDSGNLEWMHGTPPEGDANVSQNLPRLFIPNGGVYATRRRVLMEQGMIFGSDTRAVEMSLEASVDIDEPIDFHVAEAILMSGLRVR